MVVDRSALDTQALRLRPHYSHFLRHAKNEVLLTAHSHQAWPDASREGQLEAWDDAARYADKKWDRIFTEILPEFRSHLAKRIGCHRASDIAIAPNTQELGYRLLSCFDSSARVITTDSEFHSLRRQLNRLEEDGLQVSRIAAGPQDSFTERMVAAIEAEKPQLVAFSLVFFTNAQVVEEPQKILEAAEKVGSTVLVDAYHGFNVLPMDVSNWPGQYFLLGGGYKYAQGGEGACWMLCPEDASNYRPRNTGWFADFAGLERFSGQIDYGPGGQRFMGATFDPSAYYRSNHSFRFMDRMGLTPGTLYEAAQMRTSLIVELYQELKLAERGLSLESPEDASRRAGFISFRHESASQLCRGLEEKGVRTDLRGDILRLGPAPYTTSEEIVRAMQSLAECLQNI